LSGQAHDREVRHAALIEFNEVNGVVSVVAEEGG
jgi:hypothetical protein